MLPKTLPGFLLFAGLLMFLFALLVGSVKFKNVAIDTKMGMRVFIGALGVAFMLGSGYLYYVYKDSNLEFETVTPPSTDAPPPRNGIPPLSEPTLPTK